jgi:hypothetical protein
MTEVVDVVHKAGGVPLHEVEDVLQQYRQVLDRHGRRRDQVNLGDPAEQGARDGPDVDYTPEMVTAALMQLVANGGNVKRQRRS